MCEKRRENGKHFHFDCCLQHIHTSQIKGSWAYGRGEWTGLRSSTSVSLGSFTQHCHSFPFITRNVILPFSVFLTICSFSPQPPHPSPPLLFCSIPTLSPSTGTRWHLSTHTHTHKCDTLLVVSTESHFPSSSSSGSSLKKTTAKKQRIRKK